jgi:hypothetical protein
VRDPLDAAIAKIAREHHGLFSDDHLKQLKVTERERRHRLDAHRWERVYDLVYRVAGVPTTWKGDLLAACWAGGMRAVASHRSAAGLYQIPGGREDLVEITCPRWRRAQHDGLLAHETSALGDHDRTVVDKVPATTVERTIFDLASVCGPFTVELAIDNALRRALTTLDKLGAMLRRVGKRGRKGTKLLRSLLAERDPTYAPTESEREFMLLRVLRDHGLPEPERQFSIHDGDGSFIARPDLVYLDRKIAMEYDSYQHHIGKAALVRDSRRRNAMTVLGWIVLVATAEDVRYGGGQTFARDVREARRSREPASRV